MTGPETSGAQEQNGEAFVPFSLRVIQTVGITDPAKQRQCVEEDWSTVSQQGPGTATNPRLWPKWSRSRQDFDRH